MAKLRERPRTVACVVPVNLSPFPGLTSGPLSSVTADSSTNVTAPSFVGSSKTLSAFPEIPGATLAKNAHTKSNSHGVLCRPRFKRGRDEQSAAQEADI